jgi:hypothetical protein
MRQCNRKRRVPAWTVTLPMVLCALMLASCGGSSASKSTSTAARASATSSTPSSTSTSPSAGSGGAAAPATGSTSGQGTSTSGTGGSKPEAPKSSAPIARASKFVACMRAHGVNLPAAKRSGSGVTLEFKGINTHSPQYEGAVAACAHELLGKLYAQGKGRIPLAGIRISGINLKSIHIGHIEVPNIHVGSIPPVHVTTPDLGGQTSGEPPTQPKSGGEPES